MTNSTKQALVKHVERAVADGSYRRQQAMQRLAGPLREQHRACDPRHRVEDAIRATLEWARDSVSEGMRDEGRKIHLYIADPDVTFRAMLSALIQELDKGDGG